MKTTVADVMRAMESIAPVSLAETWDNPGLQVGKKDHPARVVWVSLDASSEVAKAAVREKADLLVCHHPLIFRPLKSIDVASPAGSVIQTAMAGGLAIFAAHTNLDSAAGGVNDALAEKIGLKNPLPLARGNSRGPGRCKFVTYAPAGHEDRILEAMFEAGAGVIGEYSRCSFMAGGRGSFMPGDASMPFSGEPGEFSKVDEVRIETVAEQSDLPGLVAHVKKAHPYETMAYDVYPLFSVENPAPGPGRVGDLEKKTRLGDLAAQTARKLGLRWAKIAGDPDLWVEKAALCAGSGSGMVKDFIASGAQAYISGDLGHHDALDIAERGLGAIDVGHFASEIWIVERLARRLRRSLARSGVEATVYACPLEKDPFTHIHV